MAFWHKKGKGEEETLREGKLRRPRKPGKKDLELVLKLQDELVRNGVVEPVRKPHKEERFGETQDFKATLDMAVAAARFEREQNPDFYAPEVEAEVSAREAAEEDWNNPMLDYVDEFEEQSRSKDELREDRPILDL